MTEKEKERNFGPIWNELKRQPLQVFGLPSQTVEMYFQPMMGDEKKLILTMLNNRPLTAAVIALETVLQSFLLTKKEEKRGPQNFGLPDEGPKYKFTLEQSPGYLTVKLNS